MLVGGAAIQWLRDGLGLIGSAAETEQLAREAGSTGGVFFVPALTGLGAPHWDPEARGLISGLTRGTTRAHLVRAALEAMAHQVADIVDVLPVAAGALRADGGATANSSARGSGGRAGPEGGRARASARPGAAAAQRMARRAPIAIRGLKRAVYEGASLPLERGLATERKWFMAEGGKPGSRRAMAAYVRQVAEGAPWTDDDALRAWQDGTAADLVSEEEPPSD